MTKEELIKLINDIFNNIDNGKDETYNTGLQGHPALYVWHSKEELENKINEIIEEKDNYDRYDLFYYTEELIKFMIGKHDSHTSLCFTDSFNLPIEVRFINNMLYIVNSNNKEFVGSYIENINGINISTIIKELEKITCYANMDYLKMKIESEIIKTCVLRSLPSLRNFTTFEIETNKGVLNFDVNNKEELKRSDKKDNFTLEKRGNTAIITYNSCRNEDAMSELIYKLKESECDKFIVDIRGNFGGNSNVSLPLIEFLRDKDTIVISDERVFSSARMFLVSMKKNGAFIIGKRPSTPINCFGNNVIHKNYTDLNLRLNAAANYWYYDDDLKCVGITKKDFLEKYNKIKNLMDYKYANVDYECTLSLEDYINKTDSVLEEAIILSDLKDKLSFLGKSKEQKISLLIDNLSRLYPDIPSYLVIKSKEMYLNDKRKFSEIGKEIFEFSNKIKFAENIVSKQISDEVLNNSILLIGPMGSGKSTIANELHELTGLNRVSLDNDKQLEKFYKHNKEFKNFKEFEFYLTSSVLTSLNEPTVIDFGGGHSVYENPIMFYEMKKLIKKFKNTFLLLPSKDLDESLKVLNDRLSSRRNADSLYSTNKHFLESNCNYELASDIIYTKDMKVEDIANMILIEMQNKKIKETSVRR